MISRQRLLRFIGSLFAGSCSLLALAGPLAAGDEATPREFPIRPAAQPAAFGFQISYQGTPVTAAPEPVLLTSVHAQAVYLGKDWNASANLTTKANLDTYVNYLVGSTFMSMLSVYGVGTGTATAGVTVPAELSKYTAAKPTYLSDAQIQNYLNANFANSTLIPPTNSTLHIVYVEPGVAVGSSSSSSINSFLGYHTQGVYLSQPYAYAVMPYPGSPNPAPTSQGFANAFDELTSVTSHEVAEGATDPDLTTGWNETVLKIYKFVIGPFTLFQFSVPMPGEEIGDVPLILYNYGSICFARLNNYEIQKQIAKDGTSLLTPSGAIGLSSSATPAPIAATLTGLLNSLLSPASTAK